MNPNMWGQDQYPMPPNMMGMPPQMMNQMPPPLMPPLCMMGVNTSGPPMNPPNSAPPVLPGVLIGPVRPDEEKDNSDTLMVDDFGHNANEADKGPQERNRRDRDVDGRGDKRSSRDRERDRSHQQRPRSHDRHDRKDRNDRNDHNLNDRYNRNDNKNDRGRRERRSKWDSDQTPTFPGQSNDGMPGNVIMPGMMPYGQMSNNNMMVQQHGAMSMGHIPTQNAPNMPGMANMMPGMNMMPNILGNVMDQNIMMMNHQASPLVPNQPIFMNSAVLLPPIPGVSMPNRREKPAGCRTIFVGGLPNEIREDIISEMFQRFGEITDIKLHRQGVCHVRFARPEMVEMSFHLSGYRFKRHDQMENEATTMFVDYALNRDDQTDFERNRRHREPTPPRVESFTPTGLAALTDKIKSDDQFGEAAPTLAVWLERGECNKKNANSFYSLIQASNNQIRRLFSEKMALDDDYQNMKTTMRDKFANVVMQFEQVAKILTAAKHQRVSDHFTKQQRRNIEMWLKMTEEVENIKEEFNSLFDEEETEKLGRNAVPAEKYEELRAENENLVYELEGYKNEAYLAKDEAERKFEKFKAHFIAQQALQTGQQVFPPLPPQPPKALLPDPPLPYKPLPPPPTPDDGKIITSGPAVPPSEAKLISVLTAFLLVHPLGASLDYLVSYVRSMVPVVTQATVNHVLQKYNDVFSRKTTGIGASIEHRWVFVTYDLIKREP